jgi:hypothetical protein
LVPQKIPALFAIVLLAALPCYAGKPVARDGSSKDKAIMLKQRGSKATEEEMTWMTKLHGSNPVQATRDEMTKAVAEIARRVKAGQKAESVHPPQPWSHATLDHNGQVCSYWWFTTPRGRKEMYFDAGVAINTPGEVVRQESSRAEYMKKAIGSMTIKLPK